jgi:serine/threonine protein kinase
MNEKNIEKHVNIYENLSHSNSQYNSGSYETTNSMNKKITDTKLTDKDEKIHTVNNMYSSPSSGDLLLKEYYKESQKYHFTINNVKYSNATRIGDYIYYSPSIGRGSFSKVFIGHHIKNHGEYDPKENSNKLVAIKRINTSNIKKMSLNRLQTEITLLKKLSHKNIVKFYEAFTDISNNIYIVTEYCNNGNLQIYTKDIQLSDHIIKGYIDQVREGLKYLLCNNILHRDLKPQNILLDKQGDTITLKIADFGFAKHFESLEEESMSNTLCGTPMYLAPEVIVDRKYTLVSDLWSIGVIIYELFHHCTPFRKPKNLLELTRNIDTMKLKCRKTLDQNAIYLLRDLLQIDPHKRITWDNFFTHEWFDHPDYNISQSSKGENNISQSFGGKIQHINREISNPIPIKSNQSIIIPKNLHDDSSDDEEFENRGEIPINNPEKSFLQQTTRIYQDINIVNDYIQFMPSSCPTEKVVPRSSSPWTNSPVLKYITSSLSKITEAFSLGGK